MIDQLYLDFSIPAWIIFILSLLLFGIAIRYYWHTLPPLSRFRQYFLTGIRAIVLIIILFLIFQPVMQLIFQKYEKPAVAILYDNSGSMRIEDSFGKRGDSLQYALSRLRETWPADSVNLKEYQFSGELRRFPGDSLSYSGSQTNLSSALSSVMDSVTRYNIRSMVLLSDGQFNEGINPAEILRESTIPLNTVTVGDTASKKDLKITGVRYNPVMYAGDSLKVEVSLTQTGFEATNVMVQIKQNRRQVAAKSVILPQSEFQKSVDFLIVPDEPGQQRYQVDIEPLEGEFIRQNNRKQFMIKVLKSRLKVMLISGSPSFDQRLLVHVLKTLPDIDLEVRTESRSGGFYIPGNTPFDPDSQDAFIFLDYPTTRSDNTPLNAVVTHIRNRKVPLFLILNDKIALNRLSSLSEFLPAEENSGIVPSRNVVPELTPLGLLHPATQIVEDPQELLNFWRNLPPVTAYSGQLRLKPEASVLVKGENTGSTAGVPLLIAGFRGGVKVLLFPVAGFGSWHFQLLDDADREQFFRMFMENSIRWLMNREDLEKIQIAPGKPVYQLGEYIEFSGKVFDDFYREVNDAEVQLEITGEEYQLKDIIPYMDDYYIYRTAGIPSGSYSYLITAQKSGRRIGERRGRFVMEELELEMQETAANIQLMKALASGSGGQHWSVQQFLKASEGFHYRSQVQFINREEVLWNKLYWLIIVIVLLSVEWFFRKRWGLL